MNLVVVESCWITTCTNLNVIIDTKLQRTNVLLVVVVNTDAGEKSEQRRLFAAKNIAQEVVHTLILFPRGFHHVKL